MTEEPRFDLYAPDPELAVFVLTVSPDGLSVQSALSRVTSGIGGPSDLVMVEQRDGTLYGESSVLGGRVFAACATGQGPDGRVQVLAVTRLVNTESVEKAAFEAAGGMNLLCRIASSVRLAEP